MSDSRGSFEPPTGFYKLYDRLILGPAPLVVIVCLAVAGFFAYQIKNFRMDASSDSIVLENDQALRYYDETRELFGSDDYVLVMYTPKEDLFSDASLAKIGEMTKEFRAMDSVSTVDNLLSVPLFHSPDIPLMKLATGAYNSLADPKVDRELAKKEILASPFYIDHLISRDAKTTSILVTFKQNEPLNKLYNERYKLRNKLRDGTITPEEKAELERVEAEYQKARTANAERRERDIATVRGIIAKYQEAGQIHEGGVPMIIVDIIAYIQRDVYVFGAAVLLFTVLMMALIFRKATLMALPFLTCLMAVLVMMGYLGWVDWRTTIVTANFTSLLLIITTENAIHIGSHWRELSLAHPEKTNRQLVLASVKIIMLPCTLATLTTMVGFASLIVSDIRPVIDFGIMMTVGLAVSLVIAFTFMPAALVLLPWGKAPANDHLSKDHPAAISALARFTDKNRWLVFGGAAMLVVFGGLGIGRLTVENRFIDYFHKDTPIYAGMTAIDDRLGGTTPLEVIIDGEGKDFWIEPANLVKLRQMHEWLDALPETGKVLSLDTMNRMLEGVNNNKPLPKALLLMARNAVPQDLKTSLLKPYVTPEFDKVRISMRVRESSHELNRKELLAKIQGYLDSNESPFPGKAHVTGMFVLYNNMLQSLFTSQIKTVFTVFISCFLTFWLLFRNWRLALIGLVPNICAVTTILGMIGWLAIPMDMMTIMIAAITFGLADDNTIHYIHRFRTEFPADRDYTATMYRCHDTIGRPLSYSMVTIVGGFAILYFSNFIPTRYFGIFTGIAMMLALICSHTLLPLLIVTFKPLGPGAKNDAREGADEPPAERAAA